jgi:hypothetical protein
MTAIPMLPIVRRGLITAVTAAWLSVVGWTWAADPDAVRRAMGEMMAAAQAMVDSGDRRDFDRMAMDAQRVMASGERTLASLPRPGNRHARDAADHVQQAIEYAKKVVDAGGQGRGEDALKDARRALSQVRRGAGHAEAL